MKIKRDKNNFKTWILWPLGLFHSYEKKKISYLPHICEIVIEDNNSGLIKQYHPKK